MVTEERNPRGSRLISEELSDGGGSEKQTWQGGPGLEVFGDLERGRAKSKKKRSL